MGAVVEPAAIKVFGLLHVIFGALGGLMGLWSVVSVFFASSMAGFGMPRGRQTERFVAAQSAYLNEVAWVSVLSGVLMVVLAVLLLVAGTGLLRKRYSGLVWSNRYAWTSIVFKGVGLVTTVLVVIPAANRMVDAMVEDASRGSEAMAAAMRVGAVVGGLLGPLAALVYPILALVLLNRGPVKRFLQARPGGGGSAG